ncbi:MAG: hypothetical protein KC964_07830, partial [Candidatus Omnitrophica bacterium]|nr:hypothetical protein [Candidatus Omnitrophota bacterium]
KPKTKKAILSVFAVLLMCLLGVVYFLTVRGDPKYEIADLGECRIWEAWDLNDVGQLVMTERPPGGAWSTFLIEPDGSRSQLKLDSKYVYGEDINNRGEIAGYVRDKNSATSTDTVGFVWNPENGFTFISKMNIVLGINDLGDFVGGTFDDNHNLIPCLRKNGGEIIEYEDDLGVMNASLKDINNHGSLIGGGYVNGKGHVAKVWKATGEVSDIPPLSNHGVFANALNNHGQILCSSSDLGNLKNSFLGISDWVKSGFKATINLKDYRHSVNKRFFVWKDGESADIENSLPISSGWDIVWAQGINNDGEIIGTGFYRGDSHAFLLTPINKDTEGGG